MNSISKFNVVKAAAWLELERLVAEESEFLLNGVRIHPPWIIDAELAVLL